MTVRPLILLIAFATLASITLAQTTPTTRRTTTTSTTPAPATTRAASAPTTKAAPAPVSGKFTHNGKTFELVDGIVSYIDDKSVVVYLFDRKLTDDEMAKAKTSRDAMWKLLWNHAYFEVYWDLKPAKGNQADIFRYSVTLADGGDRGKDVNYIADWPLKDRSAGAATITFTLKEGSPLTMTSSRPKTPAGDEWSLNIKLPLTLHKVGS